MAGTRNAARRDVLMALLLDAVSVAAYLICPVLNHGPDKIASMHPPTTAIKVR